MLNYGLNVHSSEFMNMYSHLNVNRAKIAVSISSKPFFTMYMTGTEMYLSSLMLMNNRHNCNEKDLLIHSC